MLFAAATAPSLPAAEGFAIKDETGKHLDVLSGGKVVARYMYAYDKSTPAKLLETYKPYLHVFDAEGNAPITKGPGGAFTHHRGIYIGWSKITFNGKSYDRWHMKGGEQVHQSFTAQKADATQAAFTSLVHWNDEAGKEFIVEERTFTFLPAPAPGHALIDFKFKLTAPRGDVKLDGDPEHAGIHFRPADEVDKSKTSYVFPAENPNAHKDLDYPWVGETFSLRGKLHSVVEMSHPGNPKGTPLVRLSRLRPLRRVSHGDHQVRRGGHLQLPLPHRRRRNARRRRYPAIPQRLRRHQRRHAESHRPTSRGSREESRAAEE